MNKKWILSLIPISLTIMATTASGQSSQISNAAVGPDNQQSHKNSFLPDTTLVPVPTDSTFANLQNGWHKAPGQMPIFKPGQLPNSMPNLIPPLVDEEMIIPITGEKADTLRTSTQDSE